MSKPLKTKKRNWVKGVDRIAILLAFPIFAFYGYYSSLQFAESQGRIVFLPPPIKGDIFDYIGIFGVPDNNGVIADGKNELQQLQESNPEAQLALNEVFENGGDLCGTLISRKKFGLKSSEFFDDMYYLIPKKSERYKIGILKGIGAATSFVVGIGILNRGIPKIIHWVKNGFLNTNLQSCKRKKSND